jgi:tetratricopeptide (TPR) repeat protein
MSNALRHAAVAAAVLALAAAGAHAQAPLPGGSSAPATRIPAKAGGGESSGLSADLFYRILLGDIALQRGDIPLAARAYFEAARTAQDARLAQRATEIALIGRLRSLAQESATLWSKLAPDASRPKRVLEALASGDSASQWANAGAEDLRTRLEKLLADAARNGSVGEVFLQINRAFAQQSDPRAVLGLVRELAKPYGDSPEAHFAVALSAYNVGPMDAAASAEAQREIDAALAQKPDWDRAALLKSEVLARRSRADAIAFLAPFVDAHPDSRPVAGALAQLYVDDKRLPDARAVLQRLLDRAPDSQEAAFGVAAVALQMKDYATAVPILTRLKAADYGEPGLVDLYLAEAAESQRRYEEAIDHYRDVPADTPRGWAARLRVGTLYGKLKRVDEGRRWLADLPAVTAEQRIQVRQAEAQMLREAGDEDGAYQVLASGLDEHPDSTDLLYDSAMVAEKLGRVDEAEKRLKRLVELKPDDAQALNALGYTLVDRTGRTEEGYALIEKAHALSPTDPFILDSMGWALYRMGRLPEAETYLRRALAQRNDAEIAAHLGEVLWARGAHEDARAVWQPQLDSHPDNAVLQETVRRLSQ